MEPHLNPFSVLSWIIAPALLTNASTLLVLSTGNRLARAVDRARDLFKQLEDAADLTSREAIRRLGELTATEQRSLMLVAALRSVYIASGSFASATLVSLFGALIVPIGAEALVRVLEACAVVAGLGSAPRRTDGPQHALSIDAFDAVLLGRPYWAPGGR